jgi:hypothetical protein
MNKINFTIFCLTVVFLFTFCQKKNKESDNIKSDNIKSCNINCLNGGTCLNNACNCPSDWSGPNCETFLIYKFEGNYTSTKYTCSSSSMVELNVRVDSIDKNSLWVGSILVTRDTLTIFKDNGQDLWGSHFGYTATFAGNTMTLNYLSRTASINYYCGGTFTKN